MPVIPHFSLSPLNTNTMAVCVCLSVCELVELIKSLRNWTTQTRQYSLIDQTISTKFVKKCIRKFIKKFIKKLGPIHICLSESLEQYYEFTTSVPFVAVCPLRMQTLPPRGGRAIRNRGVNPSNPEFLIPAHCFFFDGLLLKDCFLRILIKDY